MTHEWADRLSEYLDGELNARERASVEAHVKGCAECTRTLAGAVWLALERRTTLRAVPGPEPAANAALGTSDATVPEPEGVVAADFGFTRYDAAIADLERTLEQHRGQLDPATVRVVELNLRLIDRAIAQARRALESDPANPYLNNHLADQMRLKVDVLRQITALIHA